MAAIVLRSMLSMFLWAKWAKTMVTPDASPVNPGALARTHSRARWSSWRRPRADALATTVMRVADLATSMRSFKSLPSGSDSSYSSRFWADSAGSSGIR